MTTQSGIVPNEDRSAAEEHAEEVAAQRKQLIAAAGERVGSGGGLLTPELVDHYWSAVHDADVVDRTVEEIIEIPTQHLETGARRDTATAVVRVLEGEHGSGVQVVTDDMPFLVDSVTYELHRLGWDVHSVVHPQVVVTRGTDGELQSLRPWAADEQPADGELVESWIHVDVRQAGVEADVQEVCPELERVLEDVRVAVEDWEPMREQAAELTRSLRQAPPPTVDAEEAAQGADLLEWLVDDHFTFLGIREYALDTVDGELVLRAEQGTGLGILRGDRQRSHDVSRLRREAREKAHEPRPVTLTKANSRATVHRNVHLDYVGVRTFDEQGEVTGEIRILGLLTSTVYNASVREIPVVREKVQAVLDASGFGSTSHSGKDLLATLEAMPRDDLFQTGPAELEAIAHDILWIQSRRRPSVLVRRDEFGRYATVTAFLPRDRYNTDVRTTMTRELAEYFDTELIDFTARVTDQTMAQLRFVVRLPDGRDFGEIDLPELERRLIEATRTWDEKVTHISETNGIDDAYLLPRLAALPQVYRDDFAPEEALEDLGRLDGLDGEDDVDVRLYADDDEETAATDRRLKVYRRGPATLSDILPVFSDFGLEVVDERPYEVRDESDATRIYDFGLRAARPELWESDDSEATARRFEETFKAAWSGQAESDSLNALSLTAGLDWRQIVILRAYARYLRQTGSAFSLNYIEEALTANPRLAGLFVEAFEILFDPSREGEPEARRAEAEPVLREYDTLLEEVSSLDQDRILRGLREVLGGTLRTSFYVEDLDGSPKPYVALKLSPVDIELLPEPRPMFEIFVYGPSVEGVHLRYGSVARGGLRWSDRREDFRTEVLGLVKAQMVKNAVIVPTGSKGGFYAKQLPDPSVDRGAWMEEGKRAYTRFISGMLDVTDNLVDGEVVPARDVVRHDGDDTYLVVAADKGTAKFSDLANSISESYGFWLGDAFASGGSAGYDHKAMGITARGAWESVKRHFRELGHDTQTEDFTVVGIGDMGGDVFGNGMLLSEHIRLVGAFNHLHVFVDPNPDAAATHPERKRLFETPGTTWADFDSSLISEGGGVFERSAKSVPVSPQMREALGLEDEVETMTPNELIHALLQAPVDLVWNGGIGTYIKGSDESDASVGDRANDAIRITGQQVRAAVVGEGGNLGATQLGRIEAARNGVRINTDAIDNSAGVASSDQEVNIKIPLNTMVQSGQLDLEERNEFLAAMTDDVARIVLRDNYEQNVLLGNARARSAQMAPVHQRLMRFLEREAGLDRALEFLPSAAELNRRIENGEGLSSPEFAVLVAYAKLQLKDALLESDLPDDEWFTSALLDYLPPQMGEKHADQILEHPLRREIIVNSVVNSMVNRGGITFAFRALEETGAQAAQVARAYVVAREVFDLKGFVEQVEALDNAVPTEAQTTMYLEFRRLLDRAVRWFVGNRPAKLDIGAEIERFRAAVAEVGPKVPEMLRLEELERFEEFRDGLLAQDVPEELAVRSAALLDVYSLLDVVTLAGEVDQDVEELTRLYFAASEEFGFDALLNEVARLPQSDRWGSLARGALRDDLYAVHLDLLRAIVASGHEGTPEERVQAWAEANGEAFARTEATLRDIQALEEPGVAPLSVALRTLRSVVRLGASS
ncbi:glutamate dehydrogenase (NAD) [Kytococcus aerolatus]|uniref:Glutamate dehydrogenase (NAD) n=1 Tax=Kytococcus aerolatus TaxID=592308 RepID=A0A212TZV9_9MICO|nr:NAD-glutamate dehydrogenase [Kytococcus aerolatus]SNC71528.1 glutamate dehydrogenase (NAD) [Kytococcus aerolatus]